MTDKTNQCSEHSGLAGCAANLKKEIDDKMWPAIRKVSDKADGMVPRWIFMVVGGLVIGFGLILISNNALSIDQNDQEIKLMRNEIQMIQNDICDKLDRIEKAVQK